MFDARPGRKKADGFAPRINGLWSIAPGRVVVLITVTDRNWKQGVHTRRLPDGERTFELVDLDRVFDTIVEVLDLRRNVLLAQQRFDTAWLWLLPSGRLVRYRDDDVAGGFLELSRLQVVLP